MGTIKKIIIISIVGGASFAVAIAIIGGIFFWYQNKSKEWNINAITATYDMIDTEGENSNIVFYYTLQNNTDFDYKFSDLTHITLMAKLERQNSLSGNKNDEGLKPDYPILAPAKQRVRIALHLRYPYEKRLKKDASIEEKKKFRKDLEAYVNEEFSNLDGFVLFDELRRYQIYFPKGW